MGEGGGSVCDRGGGGGGERIVAWSVLSLYSLTCSNSMKASQISMPHLLANK